MSINAQIELINTMSLLQLAIPSSIDEGLEQAGKYIVDLASELAPKDTGALSESGKSEVIDHVLYISFGNDLPDNRAFAQEYGTLYTEAQPYLMPAVKEISIAEEVAKSLRRRLE